MTFALRSFQVQALQILSQKDPVHLAVCAPTGSGKSLIYERTAVLHARRSILVTPLQALGRQQWSRLSQTTGLRLGLGLSTETRSLRAAPYGHFRQSGLWIVSPEMLLTPWGKDQLRRYQPDFWAIDEAHCVWLWGQNFRPAYRELLTLLQTPEFRPSKTLWLSATFPPGSREELGRIWGGDFHSLGKFSLPSLHRIFWEEVPSTHRISQLQTWLFRSQGPGVIFVSSRQAAERVCKLIGQFGVSTRFYHAGLPTEMRRALEKCAHSSEIRVWVATSAFGMGIDLPHLNWCLFWDLPYSVMDLAQQMGRVGRAGQRCHSVLFWHPAQLSLDHPLRELLQRPDCRREALAAYFESHSSDAADRPHGGECCDFCSRHEPHTPIGSPDVGSRDLSSHFS